MTHSSAKQILDSDEQEENNRSEIQIQVGDISMVMTVVVKGLGCVFGEMEKTC